MQLEIFENINEDEVEVAAPPLIASDVIRVPEAELLNLALKGGDLANAVKVLNKLNLEDLMKVLLTAGFAIGHAPNRNKLILSVQKDLIAASNMKMTGYQYLSFKNDQHKQKTVEFTKQFIAYKEFIAAGRGSKGMLEQARMDVRMNDGEHEILLAIYNKIPQIYQTKTEGVVNGNPHIPQQIRPQTHDFHPGQQSNGHPAGEPLDAGMAGSGASSDQDSTIRTSFQDTVGTGTGGTGVSGSVQPSFNNRAISGNGIEDGATNVESADYRITDQDNLGSGGLTKKFNDNIRAIRILKELDRETRIATLEERMDLAKYSGFGALKSVFDARNNQWQQAYKVLKELLTEEEYESARASVLNAHYTSKLIVDTMYKGVERLGFQHGDILESSLGSGNFFGLMPQNMRASSSLYGVELDLLTSKLAKALYPAANIAVATAFQHYNIPGNFFDLAIGNPPYGSEAIIDRVGSGYSGYSIHNYFLCKQIDKVRDGGIVVAVVSNSFLDATKSDAREWIAQRANLISAVRLPNNAFLQNAGTEVVTDILFFQKSSQPEINPSWINTQKIDVINSKTQELSESYINNYFIKTPDNVLGINSATGTMYKGNSYTVEPNGELDVQLNQFVETLPESIYTKIEKENVFNNKNVDGQIPTGVKVGCYFYSNGLVKQRGEDFGDKPTSFEWVPKNGTAIERMKQMIKLREVLRDQIKLERSDTEAYLIEINRKLLNKLYDEFQAKYGYLNNRTNRSIFIDDTDSPLLQSLEFDYDPGISKIIAEGTGVDPRDPFAKKADIFSKRVIFPQRTEIIVESAKDALLASFNERGRLDLEYIAGIYAKDKQAIIVELGDLIYKDIESDEYVTSDEYLSGDVKTKLEKAQLLAQSKPELTRNVEALKKIIPRDKLPSEIHASLGAGWIPTDVYIEFAKKITGGTFIEMHYVRATAQWVSSMPTPGDIAIMKNDYGTPDVDSFKLLSLTMANRAPEVKKTILRDGKEVQIVDEDKTDAAREKQNKIKADWETWVWSDSDRSARLADLYNEKHNRIVNRKYDGSHLTLLGINPAITLLPTQKNAIWRGIQERNFLLDHIVGAGKTYTIIAIIMECKRLGMTSKPLISVPNHLTLQWRTAFTQLYPAANVLAATPDDFEKTNRQKLFSKIAISEYDAVIVGHSSLKKIELSADIESKIYKDQLNEIAHAIEDMKLQRGDRGIIRDMEKIKANLEAKFEKLKLKTGKKDKVLTFDELGIDAFFNDEHHEFKNLFFYTQMQRVAGLGNPLGSGKAVDLFTKFLWMQDHYGENAIIGTATGTPISNSLTEMFTIQRYHKYNEMRRNGLHLFDSWAHMYGEVENVYEVSTSGIGYRVSQRFSKFKNMSSLMATYLSFADVVTKKDLVENAKNQGKRFPIPTMVGGKQQNIIAKRSPQQAAYFGIPFIEKDENGQFRFELDPSEAIIEHDENKNWYLKTKDKSSVFDTQQQAIDDMVSRSLAPLITIDKNTLLGKFANLKELTRETKGQINALSLTSLANKAGLDMRIINSYSEDFPDSKINLALRNMMDLYTKWEHVKGTQLIFCDSSVPFSARKSMAQQPRRVYVYQEDDITHKSGTLHTVAGFEHYKFFAVKTRVDNQNKYAIFEPMTGKMLTQAFVTRSAAIEWFESAIKNEEFRFEIDQVLNDAPHISTDLINDYRSENELEVVEDGSNEFTPDDLIAVSSPAQFSVYEDMKAKLISFGVPEHEIAFIHDYDTPTKKAALYHNMNIGSIRYMFGSTQKMGAGTNVQRLLVGLHNIDCPWRPSDLEQREGRGLRQGNMLYEADPENFRIFVGRYATEQTYDTRRWQLIEHKASGIESVRNYQGENEIEGDVGEAANSADMKASTSGNPLILEETKLRTEVKRLNALRKSHIDSQAFISRAIKNNIYNIDAYYPSVVKRMHDYLQILSEHAEFKGEELYKNISVAKKSINNNEQAYNEIKNVIDKARAGFGQQSFEFRGFKLLLQHNQEGDYLNVLLSDNKLAHYLSKETISIPGLVTRIRNQFNDFPTNLKYYEDEIDSLKAENKNLLQRKSEFFEFQNLLDQTTTIHNTVKMALMNQSQLEAIPPHEKEHFKRVVAEREKTLIEMGYGEAVINFKKSNHIDLDDVKRRLATLQQNEIGVGR